MSLITYALDTGWSAANRYTAAADVDVSIANPDTSYGRTVRWTITTTDALPSEAPDLGTVVRHSRDKAIQLKTGERLWLAGSSGATATVRD